MDYNYILNKIDKKKLLDVGFTLNGVNYIKKIDLNDSFYVIIEIGEDVVIKVYDKDFDDEYLLFNNTNVNGDYVSNIREKVDIIIKSIVDNTKVINNNIEDVITYVKEKYNAYVHNPFKDNDSIVLKNDKNKWFGLIMKIKYKVLGVNSLDDVNIINIKLDTDVINKLIDNKVFFKAYHMNKNNWITINLDSNIDFNYLCKLIDDSYNNVK